MLQVPKVKSWAASILGGRRPCASACVRVCVVPAAPSHADANVRVLGLVVYY